MLIDNVEVIKENYDPVTLMFFDVSEICILASGGRYSYRAYEYSIGNRSHKETLLLLQSIVYLLIFLRVSFFSEETRGNVALLSFLVIPERINIG